MGRRPSLVALKAELEDRRKKLGYSYDVVANGIGTDKGTIYSAIKESKRGDGIFDRIDAIAKFLEYGDRDALYAAAWSRETGGIPSAFHCLNVGTTQTLWFHAFGTGLAAGDIRPEEFRMRVDLSPSAAVTLDDELLEAVQRTERERDAGQHSYENNRVFALRTAEWSNPRGRDERTVLDATITTHDYSLFYTLTRTEHGRALLRNRMKEWRKGQIVPSLSAGLGIGIAIVSVDGRFIFGRRERTQGPRPMELDVGAVEGFSPRHDFDLRDPPRPLKTGSLLDVDWAARRGLSEEYGIDGDEVESLHYLGFGYDLEYGQWNIMALAKVSKTGDQIERRRKFAKHHEFWETIRVACEPKDVFRTITEDREPVWSFGIALAFLSMVRMHGKRKAEEAAEDFNLRPVGFWNKTAAPI